MAEAPKPAAPGFDFFGAVNKFIKKLYGELEKFIDTSNPGLKFTPYYIVGVFLYFFFFFMPFEPHANAVWFPIFTALVPLVLPVLLYKVGYDVYFEYEREKNYWSRQYCVLEIKLPEDIPQSPFAMELVLRGLYQTGEIDTGIQEIIGVTKAWFSLEMISTEGRVRFYMWGRRAYKTLMENQIYAHYPTVQVVEVEDYTLQVPYDPREYAIWGVEQRLQKPDPYPILTYKEFETLEPRRPEEEMLKNDPMAAIIEFLGSIGEGEHVWFQFIIRAHEPSNGRPPGICPYSEGQAADTKGEHLIHHPIALAEWTQIEIDKILARVKKADDTFNFAGLTKQERQFIEAMQDKLNKQPFDTGIRGLYIAKHDKFRGMPRQGIPSAFRSFEHGSSGRGLNGLAPVFWVGPFDYPWHDFRGIRRMMLRKRYYDAYVTRQFFWMPHRHKWIVLNSEEIATLYHFPGRVVATPNLERMPSRRGEAPANLPT